jgi:hypothetical protein
MNLFKRLLGSRSVRSESLLLYKQGMTLAERGDRPAAMIAYTSAIEQPDSPDDVRAMALYNRALLLAADGKTEKAFADLQAVMEMPIPMAGVKLAARRRLDRLEHRQQLRANRRS